MDFSFAKEFICEALRVYRQTWCRLPHRLRSQKLKVFEPCKIENENDRLIGAHRRIYQGRQDVSN